MGKAQVSIMRLHWLLQRLENHRRTNRMRRMERASRGFLGRLAADRAGNALAIVTLTAFMVITLAGLGMDMSRAYLTKTSLQNACDAGVLAGRKAMAATGTYGTNEQARANKMFNFNINENATDSTTAVFNSSADTSGHVNATASTTMPTTLMKLMGYTSLPLTVQCSAELQMANADVMFVLDTTGSMGCTPSGSNCVSGTDSKIAGLQNAIRSFYTTVAGAVTDKANTRIRFGFVPYSMTVNVKNLLTSGAMPTNYFVDSSPYITKLVQFSTTPTYVGTNGSPAASTETYGSTITQANCTNYGNNTFPSGSGGTPVTSGTAPANVTTTTYSYKSWTKVSGSGSSALGNCVRNKSVTVTTYAARYLATGAYRYTQSVVNVSAFKGFTATALATRITAYTGSNPTTASYVSVQPNAANPYFNIRDLATGTIATGLVGNVGTTNYTWGGCLEERNSVNQSSMSPIPAGAYDMDVTNAPDITNDATRWKPYLNSSLEFYLNNYSMPLDTSSSMSTLSGACPAPMLQFTTVDTTNPSVVPDWLNTYVNGLSANGSTYHDIGMLWGARLGNPNGMFASNVNAGNLPSVSRHIIFMTDGIMDTVLNNYSAWGVTQYDGRDAPTNAAKSTLDSNHNNRFLAACTMAKNMGYTIWVIGFGTSLTTPMQSCATAGRAYYASNTTALTTTFQYIAGQVADLRLNK
jgi:Flp pilus assembly protein TadG